MLDGRNAGHYGPASLAEACHRANSLERVEYPSVKKSHIVPRGYLRNFAVDRQVAMRLVGESESRLVALRDAGTRPRFYRRTRPDGTPIDDVEWSLGHIEDKAAPLLREIEGQWPLSTENRATLAEFFGFQLVRGPGWRAWHTAQVDSSLEELRRKGVPALGIAGGSSDAEAVCRRTTRGPL